MAIKTLANSPVWPPNPSSSQAASPGPQPETVKKKSAPPPPPSPTRDNFAHHSSPTPGDKQTPYVQTTPPGGPKKMSRMPDVPMHTTKHPNPVGRPKNPRY